MSTTATTGIPTGAWNVDPAHSSVEFRVKHLGIATVTGRFREKFNQALGSGNMMVSDKVRINLDISAVKQS